MSAQYLKTVPSQCRERGKHEQVKLLEEKTTLFTNTLRANSKDLTDKLLQFIRKTSAKRLGMNSITLHGKSWLLQQINFKDKRENDRGVCGDVEGPEGSGCVVCRPTTHGNPEQHLPQHVAAEWHCLALTAKRRAEMLADKTMEREGFK